MIFRVGDKIKIDESCKAKADFERAYGVGPFRVLKVAGHQILLFEYGWWHDSWFCKVTHKEFTDEEYEALLV